MYKLHLLHIIYSLLAVVSLADAAARPLRGGSRLVVRQDGLLPRQGGNGAAVETPTQPPSSTVVVKEPTSTSVEEEEPITTTEEEGDDPATTTTTTEEPEEQPTSGTVTQPTTTANQEEEEKDSTTTEAPEPTSKADKKDDDEESTTRKPVLTTEIEVVTQTRDDGSKVTSTAESVSTTYPETQDGGGKGDGGLDNHTKNIIIGVVVGIGGAILLGAIGVVAWRIRNRKKRAEEDTSLMTDYPETKMDPPGSPEGTNSGSVGASTRNPFQATLDTYHQPSHTVNTSSNF